jgi:ABC-2 type transport system permease protein
MLWQNAFLETRWQFLIGLVLLTGSAVFVVLSYPQVAELIKAAPALAQGGDLGRAIAESAAISRTYDGYVWSQWFRQNGAQLGAFFAVIIGTGGLLAQGAAARLFTLSLPISRERLLGVRAVAGLTQVLMLALVPALVLTVVSPAVGERFGLLDALAYGLCIFAGFVVFFSIAFLFSTIFPNVWIPLFLTLCVGFLLRAIDRLAGRPTFSLLEMMHGESYYRGDGLPWPMLLVSAGLAAALIYAGVRNMARRDF